MAAAAEGRLTAIVRPWVSRYLLRAPVLVRGVTLHHVRGGAQRRRSHASGGALSVMFLNVDRVGLIDDNIGHK